MKIAIIGAGNMGMAFAKSFLQYNLVKKENLLLIEKNIARADTLRTENTGVVVDTISSKIGEYDLIILSVKPQDFKTLCPDLQKVIRPNQLLLSIMAGIPLSQIQDLLGHSLVLRAMPNAPALLGMGMTAFVACPAVNNPDLRKIENLINSTGRAVFLEDESLLDAVTALSGSGPAYFFYLVKAMIEAGVAMGFEESMATMMVKQTMIGSYHLMNSTDKTLDELIQTVASKGGTTEAALRQFDNKALAKSLQEGIYAAQERATELAKLV